MLFTTGGGIEVALTNLYCYLVFNSCQCYFTNIAGQGSLLFQVQDVCLEVFFLSIVDRFAGTFLDHLRDHINLKLFLQSTAKALFLQLARLVNCDFDHQLPLLATSWDVMIDVRSVESLAFDFGDRSW